MSLERITGEAVRQALRAIRYARPLANSPLCGLAIVDQGLRADGLTESLQSRAWILGQCLETAVLGQLAPGRGPAWSQDRHGLDPARELARLREGLGAQGGDRLTWELLYARYLSPNRLSVEQIAAATGFSARGLRQRLTRGCEALAGLLRAQEAAAIRATETAPAPPAGRNLKTSGEAVAHARPVGNEAPVVAANGHVAFSSALRPTEDDLGPGPAAAIRAYRESRIAEWGQPRYQLDERFVALSLLVDLGEDSPSGRWQLREERFANLQDVLTELTEPAVVLLGPPGSGKSTLLRRLELDLSTEALWREDHLGDGLEDASSITFLVSLNQYKPVEPGAAPPEPRAWLADLWAARHPSLPPLETLMTDGRVVLLLDGLNEMPHAGMSSYRQRIQLWKQFLHEGVVTLGNRAIVACRSLDYSAPLSTPSLRVPQVRLEPLTNEQVLQFFKHYSPLNAQALWASLAGEGILDALRWPYFLRLFIEQGLRDSKYPAAPNLAELFTNFVRQALLREVERDNPSFAPGALISSHDYDRVVSRRGWRTGFELPENGALFTALSALAHGMQVEAFGGESSQVRLGYPLALRQLGGQPAREVEGLAEELLRAGVALGVLEVDLAADEVMFTHQLLQEYFSGRRLAVAPEHERVHAPWRSAEISPALPEIAASLPSADPLPELPTTGWEETTLLAAAMADNPESFVSGLMSHNLAIAGRAANLPTVRPELSAPFLDELRWALVHRSRDREADLRARVEAGLALGWLGDPRFERLTGPHGECLLPPMVEIPGGVYPIGDDEPVPDAEIDFIHADHVPRHLRSVAPFAIGQFAVTNAEYSCFLAAGGYDDETWWNTPDAQAWRRGEGTAEGPKRQVRMLLRLIGENPDLVDTWRDLGTISQAVYERWLRRLAMSEAELEAHLAELYPGGRLTEPRYGNEAKFNNPSLPVVGISWYEARAYTLWLSAQTGMAYRLPSEVEREAATRGQDGRAFAYGEAFDPFKGNTLPSHLRRPSPIGVFVEGDTPEGVSDLSGNVADWTRSLYGRLEDHCEFGYPYDPDDGREDESAAADVHRVVRGAAWSGADHAAVAATRNGLWPDYHDYNIGFRLVRVSAWSGS